MRRGAGRRPTSANSRNCPGPSTGARAYEMVVVRTWTTYPFAGRQAGYRDPQRGPGLSGEAAEPGMPGPRGAFPESGDGASRRPRPGSGGPWKGGRASRPAASSIARSPGRRSRRRHGEAGARPIGDRCGAERNPILSALRVQTRTRSGSTPSGPSSRPSRRAGSVSVGTRSPRNAVARPACVSASTRSMAGVPGTFVSSRGGEIELQVPFSKKDETHREANRRLETVEAGKPGRSGTAPARLEIRPGGSPGEQILGEERSLMKGSGCT